MDKFCICIAYNGKWTKDYKYLDHETKLILVNDEIKFEGLLDKISQILKLKKGEIEAIWFDTKLETSKGMQVTDDEEVTTCIYLLKNDSNFKTSRLVVDIAGKKSLPAKSPKSKLRKRSVHKEVNVASKEEEGLWETPVGKDSIVKVDGQAAVVVEPTMEPEYSTTDSDDRGLRRSARLSKIKKRCTTLSKKRKRSTSKKVKVDLSSVVLREDASLDEIVVGSIFEDKRSLKKCFSNNAIKHQFKFKVTRSTSRRYYLKCFDDECSWSLHAVKVRDSASFKITGFQKKHSCSFDVLSDQRHITAKVISDIVIEIVRDTKAEVKPGVIVEEIKKRYGLTIPYHKAWRAAQIALGVIGIPEQNHEESNHETCTDNEKENLPTVILREDASLDEIVAGSIFQDRECLKKCFANNAIKHNFRFRVAKTTQTKYSLKCYDEECNWHMRSSQVYDTSFFRINKYEKNHSCSFDASSDQKHLTYKVISDYIIELLDETNAEIKPKIVVEEVRKRYGLEISYHKAWRAIQLALGVTRESPEVDEPELCPSCLHLTEGSPDIEGDVHFMEESNFETCADIEEGDVNFMEGSNLDTCADIEGDVHLTEGSDLETCADIEGDGMFRPKPDGV